MPSGERDLLEVFGQPDIDPRIVPAAFDSGLLIALAVEEVFRARDEPAAAGIVLIGDVVRASEATGNPRQGLGMVLLRGLDGNICVMQQDGLTNQGSA